MPRTWRPSGVWGLPPKAVGYHYLDSMILFDDIMNCRQKFRRESLDGFIYALESLLFDDADSSCVSSTFPSRDVMLFFQPKEGDQRRRPTIVSIHYWKPRPPYGLGYELRQLRWDPGSDSFNDLTTIHGPTRLSVLRTFVRQFMPPLALAVVVGD
jgi:hypothetical protein